MIQIVILGSGKGSNAEAILKAQEAGQLGFARVAGIISDKPDAPILQLGPRYEVPAFHLSPGPYKTKFDDESAKHYAETTRQLGPHLVVLAGFMRILPASFITTFPKRIINLHPSLLPEFPGLHSIQKALNAHVKETGCTVHWVDETVDGGDIIAQSKVSIENSDTLASLEKKVHEAEHALLPKVINDLSNKILRGEI